MPLVQKIMLLAGALLIIGYGERRLIGRLRRALRPRKALTVESPSFRANDP
jgi:hypothetical protein